MIYLLIKKLKLRKKELYETKLECSIRNGFNTASLPKENSVKWRHHKEENFPEKFSIPTKGIT